MVEDLYENDIFIFDLKNNDLNEDDKYMVNKFITNLFYRYSLAEGIDNLNILNSKEVKINDNIKIIKIRNFNNLKNGDILASLILNYYHTENLDLKEILKDNLIKEINMEDNYYMNKDINVLIKFMYISKFTYDNDLNEINIDIDEYFSNETDIAYIVKLIKDEDMNFFKENTHIMSLKYINEIGITQLFNKIFYTKSFNKDKEEKFIKTVIDYIYTGTKNKTYSNKILIMNELYGVFGRKYKKPSNDILNYIENTVDNIIKNKVKDSKYKEFDKKYLIERIRIFNRNIKDIGVYNRIDNYLKYDKETYLGDNDDIVKAFFFNNYQYDSIFRLCVIFKNKLPEKENVEEFFIKLLDLINKNTTTTEKKKLMKDILNPSFNNIDKFKYNDPSFLVSKSKGELKRIIMHNTVKKTFI
ncbi:hypothetical protein CPT_Machias_106 [Staphylococcus phage Machias]|nr:hypothetical protein CPT_Machias_106 [Staphylococcus phage Machias]